MFSLPISLSKKMTMYIYVRNHLHLLVDFWGNPHSKICKNINKNSQIGFSPFGLVQPIRFKDILSALVGPITARMCSV